MGGLYGLAIGAVLRESMVSFQTAAARSRLSGLRWCEAGFTVLDTQFINRTVQFGAYK